MIFIWNPLFSRLISENVKTKKKIFLVVLYTYEMLSLTFNKEYILHVSVNNAREKEMWGKSS
jgi:hypothetical protein